MDSIGQKIINEIIRQNMVRTDEAEPRLLLWSANAAEQLDGLVAHSAEWAERARSALEAERRWDTDRRIFCGALQLLKEAGLSPGSTELLSAADRFDSENLLA